MSDMLNNNGFWTLAGIILGGLITHVFWYLQTKRQEKIKVRTDRQNKINEICTFCNTIIEKSKFIYKITVTGAAKDYFFEHTEFWSNVPVFQNRMIVQMFFPKCIDTFDELQISLDGLVTLMHNSMRGMKITYEQLDSSTNELKAKVNELQNKILDCYSKELCVD